MAYELIPFPISIIFIVVFGIVCILALYKLRKNGKFYSILFKLSLILGSVFAASILYMLISGMLA